MFGCGSRFGETISTELSFDPTRRGRKTDSVRSVPVLGALFGSDNSKSLPRGSPRKINDLIGRSRSFDDDGHPPDLGSF